MDPLRKLIGNCILEGLKRGMPLTEIRYTLEEQLLKKGIKADVVLLQHPDGSVSTKVDCDLPVEGVVSTVPVRIVAE